MADHRGEIPAVMVGIGGVFPIYAGILSQAPRLVREAGFEWLYRLVQEPGRLWKRYARTIPPFLWLAGCQVLGNRLGLGRSPRVMGRPRAETIPAIGLDVKSDLNSLGHRVKEVADKLTSVDHS